MIACVDCEFCKLIKRVGCGLNLMLGDLGLAGYLFPCPVDPSSNHVNLCGSCWEVLRHFFWFREIGEGEEVFSTPKALPKTLPPPGFDDAVSNQEWGEEAQPG